MATVKADLAFSGYFKVVDPALFQGMDLSDAKVDYTAWQAMAADYLLLTTLYSSSGQLTLEGRLYDVKRKEMVTGKRIKSQVQDARVLGHNLSAVILEYLFGAGSFPTSQILFTSHLGNTEDIFLCDYDGRGLLRLTAMGILNVTPDVSPKGDKIAFTSILKDRQELFLLDRQGRRTKLYGQGEGLNSNPRFSHDGNTIAFCSSRSGNPDVWTIGADGKNLTRLTFSWAIDTAPTWSPNDQQIAFTSDRSGAPQIYIMDRDGANTRRISPEGSGRCDQPAWSPRGDKIAYPTSKDGRFNIAVYDLNTNQVTLLTEKAGDNEAPAWSPTVGSSPLRVTGPALTRSISCGLTERASSRSPTSPTATGPAGFRDGSPLEGCFEFGIWDLGFGIWKKSGAPPPHATPARISPSSSQSEIKNSQSEIFVFPMLTRLRIENLALIDSGIGIGRGPLPAHG